ncbi:hypothetical protein HMPREF0454_03155 [Hafnia alvei ATCC 51873]|uniref:Uncharacterized protein n=1 Tax=Hafnia alvei ATCC 51873 TaxID=1002364 RepID=G9Y9I6_HAFAL|nr:hypothetical protein HMPREF0454_03155 [Hafnia alvei ATCC 51873]
MIFKRLAHNPNPCVEKQANCQASFSCQQIKTLMISGITIMLFTA